MWPAQGKLRLEACQKSVGAHVKRHRPGDYFQGLELSERGAVAEMARGVVSIRRADLWPAAQQ